MHYKELPKVGNGIDVSYQIAWRQTKRLLTRQGRKDCSELIVLREALELKTIDGFKYETGRELSKAARLRRQSINCQMQCFSQRGRCVVRARGEFSHVATKEKRSFDGGIVDGSALTIDA